VTVDQYVARIRNAGKKRYAAAFLAHRRGPAGVEPDREDFGISYMAAQAVRMEIDGYLSGRVSMATLTRKMKMSEAINILIEVASRQAEAYEMRFTGHVDKDMTDAECRALAEAFDVGPEPIIDARDILRAIDIAKEFES